MFDKSDEEQTQCHPFVANFVKHLLIMIFIMLTMLALTWTFLVKFDINVHDLIQPKNSTLFF